MLKYLIVFWDYFWILLKIFDDAKNDVCKAIIWPIVILTGFIEIKKFLISCTLLKQNAEIRFLTCQYLHVFMNDFR